MSAFYIIYPNFRCKFHDCNSGFKAGGKRNGKDRDAKKETKKNNHWMGRTFSPTRKMPMIVVKIGDMYAREEAAANDVSDGPRSVVSLSQPTRSTDALLQPILASTRCCTWDTTRSYVENRTVGRPFFRDWRFAWCLSRAIFLALKTVNKPVTH